MLNYLWAGMILSGMTFGILNGKISEITDAALNSSKEAVVLCITMTGVMAFWSGIMEIASDSGAINKMTDAMRPVIRFLFPRLPKNSEAGRYISVNFIANILGLGWAATPAGLKAMEELSKLENKRRSGKISGPVRKIGTAGNEMCTFLIINISSLQLIPVNIIAYRTQYGSENPTVIVGAGIAATAISTGTAVIFCFIMERIKNNNKKNNKI